MLLADHVYRLRAVTTDDGYGNQTTDWSLATSVEYSAEVQPLSADENDVNQQRTETRWRLWLSARADLIATDRIVWDGNTYEVYGDVERWKARGRMHHVKAILRKITQGAS